MNLNDVNWKRLIHAYGLATETPEHLRHLFCADVKLRNSAIYHLESAIIHQSTLYPATPVVLKFIIDSLTTPVLQDDESEFYHQQIRGYIARERELFEDINPEVNTPETMASLEQSFTHRRKIMEEWLASDKAWTTLENVLGFIEDVGVSLSEIDKTEIMENSRILTPKETERLDYLLDNYESLDDLEEEEFWTTDLTELLYVQAILDLFNMAENVLNAIKPFTSNKNTSIAEIAKKALESWEKAQNN